MNKIILTNARFTEDMELKETIKKNKMLLTLVAVPKYNPLFKNNADFIRIVAYGKVAENIVKYFKPGDNINLYGTLNSFKYYNQRTGLVQYSEQVVIQEFEFPKANPRRDLSEDEKKTKEDNPFATLNINDEDIDFINELSEENEESEKNNE